jgi:hypothetical protein
VDQGTTLEVIDFEKEKGWYWVVLPADLHGTRRVGWIRASSVELTWRSRLLMWRRRLLPARLNETTRQAQALAAPSTERGGRG